MAETNFGSFDDLIELTEVKLRPIAKQLRKVIFEVDPNACEVVRLGEKAATYGVGPKKMSEGYCYILPHKSWINLGFYKGAILSDSNEILEGSGKMLRHIKIHSLDDANRLEVKQLIKYALEERIEGLK